MSAAVIASATASTPFTVEPCAGNGSGPASSRARVGWSRRSRVSTEPSSATNPTPPAGFGVGMPSTQAAPPSRMLSSTSWIGFTLAILPAAALTSSPSSVMAARTASASFSLTMPRNTPPDRSCSGIPGPITTAASMSRSSRGTGAPVAAYSQAWS